MHFRVICLDILSDEWLWPRRCRDRENFDSRSARSISSEHLASLTTRTECVAEKEKRPLYTISCGDLGTEPEQLEMKLKEVFDHAVAWRAVLLCKHFPIAPLKTEEKLETSDQ